MLSGHVGDKELGLKYRRRGTEEKGGLEERGEEAISGTVTGRGGEWDSRGELGEWYSRGGEKDRGTGGG